MSNIIKKSDHLQEFKTEKMSVPALFFMSEGLLPEKETFDQVEDIASNQDTFFVRRWLCRMSAPNRGEKTPPEPQLSLKNIFYPKLMTLIRTAGCAF